jgi:hypothetical protein
MIHKAIYHLLKTVEADTYPGAVPQEVNLPYVNHYKSSITAVHSKDGDSSIRTGRYLVQIVTESKEGCRTLADSCRTALNGQTGVINTVTVDFIDYIDEQDFWSEEAQAFYITQNYYVRYRA